MSRLNVRDFGAGIKIFSIDGKRFSGGECPTLKKGQLALTARRKTRARKSEHQQNETPRADNPMGRRIVVSGPID